jgi:hypothetical protein
VLAARDLPASVDVAIAELLGPGLRRENGPAVIAALSKRATYVIPDKAILYATDLPDYDREDAWQKVAEVNLRNPVVRVAGKLISTEAGNRAVKVRADIYAQGRPIVAGLGTDDLTSPVPINGMVDVYAAGEPIRFSYDIGPMPPATPDYAGLV